MILWTGKEKQKKQKTITNNIIIIDELGKGAQEKVAPGKIQATSRALRYP